MYIDCDFEALNHYYRNRKSHAIEIVIYRVGSEHKTSYQYRLVFFSWWIRNSAENKIWRDVVVNLYSFFMG